MSAAAKPRDAASIILLRRQGRGLAVLTGQRGATAKFMPGRYVFPGGVLAPPDSRASGFSEDLPAQPQGLGAATERRLAAFARAALRELYEETGLLLGSPAPEGATGPSGGCWQAYERAGLRPAFSALRLVARAITPSSAPLRFHTRFFLADGDLAEGALGGDGELENLGWRPFAEFARLPSAEISRLVLAEARVHRTQPARPAARFFWTGAGKRRSAPDGTPAPA